MHRFVILNWKLNPPTLRDAEQLFSDTERAAHRAKNTTVVVCPPVMYVPLLADKKTKNIRVGAQDCFWETSGPYTGEISPLSLKQRGVEYVIIGHSEHVRAHQETNETVGKKITAALQAGLHPVVCVGEDEKVHIRGLRAVQSFVMKQLRERLYASKDLSNVLLHNIMVAYEPSWAISSVSGNIADDPQDAVRVIEHIKHEVPKMGMTSIRDVLYGGSVHGRNIEQFLGYTAVDGFLIGQASLHGSEVRDMIAACERAQENKRTVKKIEIKKIYG